MEDVRAVEAPAVAYPVEVVEIGIGVGLGEAALDAGLVTRAGFKLARRAESDDFAVINDGDAITEALGFLDVVRGHDDGFLFAAQFINDVVNLATHLGI